MNKKKSDVTGEHQRTRGEAHKAGVVMIISAAVKIWSDRIVPWDHCPAISDQDWLTIGAIANDIADLVEDPQFCDAQAALNPHRYSLAVEGQVR